MLKKPSGNNIICQLRQGLWLHTQREDGANTTCLLPTQINCCSHNDAIWKHENKILLPGWRQRLLLGMLQGDTLASYLFIICLDYILRTSIDKMKGNSFKLTKERSRRYPAHTIMDANYADDIALLANTPTQAETPLHSLEWADAGIGLHINTDKIEYMCFNQRGDISTLNGSSLKLVDKFTYLGSSVSSTETDINTQLAKA